MGTLYFSGQESTVGSGVKAVGEEGDVDMENGTHKTSEKVQYYCGTNALHYRRPFMEIVSPMEDGLGIRFFHMWLGLTICS